MHKCIPLLLFLSAYLDTYSQKFLPGHYYSSDGVKIEGFFQLRFSPKTLMSEAFNYVNFKETRTSEKRKLTVSETRSFVIEKDSFCALRVGLAEDFVRVRTIGRYELYEYTDGRSSAGVMAGNTVTVGGGVSWETFTYFLRINGELVMIRRKDFKKYFPSLVAEHKSLAGRIEAQELTYDEVPYIIAEFNYWDRKQRETQNR